LKPKIDFSTIKYPYPMKRQSIKETSRQREDEACWNHSPMTTYKKDSSEDS